MCPLCLERLVNVAGAEVSGFFCFGFNLLVSLCFVCVSCKLLNFSGCLFGFVFWILNCDVR